MAISGKNKICRTRKNARGYREKNTRGIGDVWALTQSAGIKCQRDQGRVLEQKILGLKDRRDLSVWKS